jgi:signal transduction histidine kinase
MRENSSLVPENVNLRELIQEISEDFSILADAKGVRLENQIELDVSVTGDISPVPAIVFIIFSTLP